MCYVSLRYFEFYYILKFANFILLAHTDPLDDTERDISSEFVSTWFKIYLSSILL